MLIFTHLEYMLCNTLSSVPKLSASQIYFALLLQSNHFQLA